MTALKQFAVGVLVIVTIPVWWALFAAVVFGAAVFFTIRAIGEGTLDAIRSWRAA